MPALERRQQIHRWKQEVLAHYVDDHQLQGFALDGDSAFFVANQLLVATGAERQRALPARGARGPAGPRDVPPDAPRSAAIDAGRGDRVRRAGCRGWTWSTSIRDTASTWPSWRSSWRSRQPGAVAPNHLVTGLQRRMGWPDGDPSRRPPRCRPSRHRCRRPAGRDGGRDRHRLADPDAARPGLVPRRRGPRDRPGEVDESGHPLHHLDHLDDDRDGYLDVEAGHGLFVAGLIRRMAPQARLVFLKALNSDGVGTELGVARAIRAATARKVDLINLSLGFYTVLDATPAGVEAAVADASMPASRRRRGRQRRRVLPGLPRVLPGGDRRGRAGHGRPSIADFSN